MGARRLGLALVAALVISLGVTSVFYVRITRAQAAARPQIRRVVAAKVALQPGTPIAAENLTEIDWPKNVGLNGLIEKKEDVAGHVLGYAVAAAFPDHYKAGLHVVFIGGFAMLALGVSTQVTLGHRGYRQAMVGKPWQVPAIGALMTAAILARAAMEFDRIRYFGWMAVASAAFLAATLVWMQLLLPKMIFKAPE